MINQRRPAFFAAPWLLAALVACSSTEPPPSSDSSLEPDIASVEDTGPAEDAVAAVEDTTPVEDIAAVEDTEEGPGTDTADVEDTEEGAGEDLYTQTLHFTHLGVTEESLVKIVTETITLPPEFETVEAQIAVRGDLDNFPFAFVSLIVEQDGALAQCGDLSGMPQPPNTFLDDVYRVAFPRPENTSDGTVYSPALPPYDFQAVPCQEAFEGLSEIELGVASVGMYPPGTNANQGPDACGGEGCPNDAIVTLRFLPNPAPVEGCQEGDVEACVCPDGVYGEAACAGQAWGECSCPEPPAPPTPCMPGSEQPCVCDDGGVGSQACDMMTLTWGPCACLTPGESDGSCGAPELFILGPQSTPVTVSNLGTHLHTVPWPPFDSACPTSKPPFSTEYFYSVMVTEPGAINVTFEAIPEPWEITQYWIDLLMTCDAAFQCSASWSALEGYAEAGTYIIGLTVAPPSEIFIPDQDDWEFNITATWTEAEPP